MYLFSSLSFRFLYLILIPLVFTLLVFFWNCRIPLLSPQGVCVYYGVLFVTFPCLFSFALLFGLCKQPE